MCSESKPPPPPSRDHVAGQIRQLVDREQTPHEVGEWASQWVVAPEPGVEDPVVWLGLTLLAGASVRVSESELLYGDEDYRSWLTRFEEVANANDEREYFRRVWQDAEDRIRNAISFLSDHNVAAEAEDYLEHNELGLALETLVARVDESGLEPPDDFWLACSDAAEVMGLHEMRDGLRRQVRGW